MREAHASDKEPERTDRENLARDQFRDHLVAAIPKLRAFALSLASHSDFADDLVQETLMKAWNHQNSFQAGTNIKAWLFTILRNEYFSQLRKRRRAAPSKATGVAQAAHGCHVPTAGIPGGQQGQRTYRDPHIPLVASCHGFAATNAARQPVTRSNFFSCTLVLMFNSPKVV